MTDKIVLTSHELSYINTGSGLLHLQQRNFRRVFCGQIIRKNAEPHVSRQVREEAICQKCWNIAQCPAYSRMWQRERPGEP